MLLKNTIRFSRINIEHNSVGAVWISNAVYEWIEIHARILDIFFPFLSSQRNMVLFKKIFLHISHLVMLNSLFQSNPVILKYRRFSFPFLNILNLKYVVLGYKHVFHMYALKFPFCCGLKFICICLFITMKLIIISRNVCHNLKNSYCEL